MLQISSKGNTITRQKIFCFLLFFSPLLTSLKRKLSSLNLVFERQIATCLIWELTSFVEISRYFFGGGKSCHVFASVGNSVNKMLWTPSLIIEAWQIMTSYIVHSNKRLIFTYFLCIWASFFFACTTCHNGHFFFFETVLLESSFQK